jgi:hypothetical protein
MEAAIRPPRALGIGRDEAAPVGFCIEAGLRDGTVRRSAAAMQHDHQSRRLFRSRRDVEHIAALGLIDGDGVEAVFGKCSRAEKTEQHQNKTGRAMSRPAGVCFGPGTPAGDQAASDFL